MAAAARGRRAPKIAVPTRTWVAPKRIAVSKSALIPMLSVGEAVAPGDLAQQREMQRRLLVLGRDAHQPGDRQAEPVAAVAR